jgi:hypothetical protein
VFANLGEFLNQRVAEAADSSVAVHLAEKIRNRILDFAELSGKEWTGVMQRKCI